MQDLDSDNFFVFHVTLEACCSLLHLILTWCKYSSLVTPRGALMQTGGHAGPLESIPEICTLSLARFVLH